MHPVVVRRQASKKPAMVAVGVRRWAWVTRMWLVIVLGTSIDKPATLGISTGRVLITMSVGRCVQLRCRCKVEKRTFPAKTR